MRNFYHIIITQRLVPRSLMLLEFFHFAIDKVKTDVKSMLGGMPITALPTIEKHDEIIKQIKIIEDAIQQQIARVTELNQNIVFKT